MVKLYILKWNWLNFGQQYLHQVWYQHHWNMLIVADLAFIVQNGNNLSLVQFWNFRYLANYNMQNLFNSADSIMDWARTLFMSPSKGSGDNNLTQSERFQYVD